MVNSEGLSYQEVLERRKSGLANTHKKSLTKSYWQIFFTNTFTSFNLFNLLIFLALLTVKAYSNLLFMGVVILNWSVAIYQEVRVKLILEKLELVNASTIEILRQGSWQSYPSQEIVRDDIIRLQGGQQIPCDSIVLEGIAEVNEALLTGEPDNIAKKPASKLYSGSYLVNGSLIAKVENVSATSYANRIILDAQATPSRCSELIKQLDTIVKFSGYFILPLGMLMIISGLQQPDGTLAEVITATAGALLGMMPRGLVLLTTLSLMVGVLRLAQKQTLTNELASIETLASVDTLCLDKTGTLTSGKMKVVAVANRGEEDIPGIMGSLLRIAVNHNETLKALALVYPVNDDWAGEVLEDFSSERKYTSFLLPKKGRYILGAYDALFKKTNPFNQATNYAYRQLVLCRQRETADPGLTTEEQLEALALFSLQEELRDNAISIIEYFKKENIAIKIISGDHPLTVCRIAKEVGLSQELTWLDLTQYGDELPDDLAAYDIYGRTTPWQKKLIIQALQDQGKTVAMCGDGINDVLALRQADCSISVISGSGAARDVSQLILMNDDFASLPSVISEGRRVINNIAKVAPLYLIKTIFSLVLSFLCLLATVNFPFAPLHLTLLGSFGSGIPSFFLALKSNEEPISQDFLRRVFFQALPTSIAIVVTYLILLVSQATNLTSLLLYSTAFLWLLEVGKLCWPLAKVYLLLWLGMILGFIVGVFVLGDLLVLQALSQSDYYFLLLLLVVGSSISLLVKPKIKKSRE